MVSPAFTPTAPSSQPVAPPPPAEQPPVPYGAPAGLPPVGYSPRPPAPAAPPIDVSVPESAPPPEPVEPAASPPPGVDPAEFQRVQRELAALNEERAAEQAAARKAENEKLASTRQAQIEEYRKGLVEEYGVPEAVAAQQAAVFARNWHLEDELKMATGVFEYFGKQMTPIVQREQALQAALDILGDSNPVVAEIRQIVAALLRETSPDLLKKEADFQKRLRSITSGQPQQAGAPPSAAQAAIDRLRQAIDQGVGRTESGRGSAPSIPSDAELYDRYAAGAAGGIRPYTPEAIRAQAFKKANPDYQPRPWPR